MPDLADADFLVATGWAEAAAAPLAGDASARSYQRLTRDDGATAVLMRSGADDSTPRFLTIAHHLTMLGFSAPEVLAGDPQEGRLLLEDLGDGVFARLIESDPAAEPTLYRAAAGFLAALHRHPAPPGLAAQTPAMLAMCETVWLQLGPTMRAVYAKVKRREPPHHHRMILAALKAGDEPGLRLAVRTDVTQGLRHLTG